MDSIKRACNVSKNGSGKPGIRFEKKYLEIIGLVSILVCAFIVYFSLIDFINFPESALDDFFWQYKIDPSTMYSIIILVAVTILIAIPFLIDSYLPPEKKFLK